MGNISSAMYKKTRKVLSRYNFNHRAEKFIQKEKLPAAPWHTRLDITSLKESNPALKKKMEELYKKNPQLNEYLKKVYLTSTGPENSLTTQSKRPLPQKTVSDLPTMFYEPEETLPNQITITNLNHMLFLYQSKTESSVAALGSKFNLEKETVVKILTNYSLYTQEKFDFINYADDGNEDEKPDIKESEYKMNEFFQEELKKIEGPKQTK